MLDSASLFTIEAFKISDGHRWQIGQVRSWSHSTMILVLFAMASVTQARPLKASNVRVAIRNRGGRIAAARGWRTRMSDRREGPPVDGDANGCPAAAGLRSAARDAVLVRAASAEETGIGVDGRDMGVILPAPAVELARLLRPWAGRLARSVPWAEALRARPGFQ
jgi:hypothetical protein